MTHFLTLDPIALIQAAGVIGVFLIIFAETGLFFGFFLPGDSLLLPIGILASQGYINPWYFLLAAAAGAILGDSLGYYLGRRYGPSVFVKEEDSFFFNKNYIEKTERFYQKHGRLTIFLARFTPFVRTFAPPLAGVGRMPYRIFAFWNIMGGIIWPGLLIGVGYYFGSRIPNIDAYIVPAVVIVVVLCALPTLVPLFRRLFSGKKDAGPLRHR